MFGPSTPASVRFPILIAFFLWLGGCGGGGRTPADGRAAPDADASDAPSPPADAASVEGAAREIDGGATRDTGDAAADIAADTAADAAPDAQQPREAGADASGDAPIDAGGFAVVPGASCEGCLIADLPNLQARRLCHDSSRRRLYVSIAGDSPAHPNTIVVLDPQTAAVVSNIPVGSEPMPVALSYDSSTLWVGLNGSYGFRKVLLSTPPVLGPIHRLPMDANGISYYMATSIVSLPDHPNTIAMSIVAGGVARQVQVYDDGVPRAMRVDRNRVASHLVRGPAGYLFGAEFGSVAVLPVSPMGISQIALPELRADLSMVYDGGRLYLDSGQVADVADPTSPRPANPFAFQGSVALRDSGRLLMVSLDLDSRPPPTRRLRVLDIATRTEVASIPLPPSRFSVSTSIQDFAHVGGDAVAFVLADGATSRLVIFRAPAIAR